MSVSGEVTFELGFDVLQNSIREKLRNKPFARANCVQKMKKIFCLI